MLCADASVPKLDIVGPYGLTHYLATMRGYTYRLVFVYIVLVGGVQVQDLVPQ